MQQSVRRLAVKLCRLRVRCALICDSIGVTPLGSPRLEFVWLVPLKKVVNFSSLRRGALHSKGNQLRGWRKRRVLRVKAEVIEISSFSLKQSKQNGDISAIESHGMQPEHSCSEKLAAGIP